MNMSMLVVGYLNSLLMPHMVRLNYTYNDYVHRQNDFHYMIALRRLI